MTAPIILDPPPDGSGYYQLGTNYLLSDKAYFTFGSNQRGIHGKGAAYTAHKYFGAVYGVGEGFTGRSYAIPTKDQYLRVRTLKDIAESIKRFIERTDMASLEQDPLERNWFFVTPVGTGLAGYSHEEIAPLFKGALNCRFPHIWKPYLGDLENDIR